MIRPSTSLVFDWLSEFCVRQVICAVHYWDFWNHLEVKYYDVVFNSRADNPVQLVELGNSAEKNSIRYVEFRLDSIHYTTVLFEAINCGLHCQMYSENY